jgi:hypothetical protein
LYYYNKSSEASAMHRHLTSYEQALKGEKRWGYGQRLAQAAAATLFTVGGILTGQTIADNANGHGGDYSGTEQQMEHAQFVNYERGVVEGGALLALGALSVGGAKLSRRWRDAYADAGEEILDKTLYSNEVLRHTAADAIERIHMRHDRRMGL